MNFFKKTSAFFAIIIFATQQLAFAGEDKNPYIIEDVAVSVSAKSPNEARNLALKTVRRDALMILLTRLSLEASISNKITDNDILEMVRSEQIVDEKIAGSSYSASFNIAFAKDFVDHILAQKNLQKQKKDTANIDEEKQISLIIPIKILQQKILLWEKGNDWRAPINKAIDGKNNFKIPVADLDNITIINSENVNEVNAADLEPMLAKYESSMIYFLSFSQENLNGKVSVVVRSLNKFNNSTQTRLNFVNSEKLENQELMHKVATKTIEYLEGQKDKESLAQNKSTQVIALEIPVNKLGDWMMIKNKIENSRFINKISIDAISCDYVKATAFLATDNKDLVDLFAKNGFFLTQKTHEIYLLTTK